jgi:hypothetical protein
MVRSQRHLRVATLKPGLDVGIASKTLDTYESENTLIRDLHSICSSITLIKADIPYGSATLPVVASTMIVPVICGCREQKYL